jgi:uncharacterized repeat protein (TIGR03803 family)
MKFVVLCFSCCLFSCLIYCQGINKIWGNLRHQGVDRAGMIFSTDARGGNYSKNFDFSFDSSQGFSPGYELMQFGGKLYGTTFRGGSKDAGTIFEWDPVTNDYKTRTSIFSVGGQAPSGNLTLWNNKIYGVSISGGKDNLGIIFEWDPISNQLVKIFDFSEGNGSSPIGGLVQMNGMLYGMASKGGANNKGVIFEVDPSLKNFSRKFDFDGGNGDSPQGKLVPLNNKLYGMTPKGGTNDEGVIFEWDPGNGSFSKKIDFAKLTGSNPNSDLVLLNGVFYGVTQFGGSGNYGVIFSWQPSNNQYSKYLDFLPAKGIEPLGNLTIKDNKLYGMTSGGGAYGRGAIFQWDPFSKVFQKMYDFKDIDGKRPFGSLTSFNNLLFGTTGLGGIEDSGVLFEWNNTANVYSKKYDFVSSAIMFPDPLLIPNKTKLVGVGYRGIYRNRAVIFEYDMVSKKFSVKADLEKYKGVQSWTSSLARLDNKYYGIRSTGNPSPGVFASEIFELDAISNQIAVKHTMSQADGIGAVSSMTTRNDKFYGVTSAGGDKGAGTIFEWDPVSNVYSKKYDLDSLTGYDVIFDLVMLNDKFYGVAINGGANDFGTLFEWDPVTNRYSKKLDFDLSKGGYPCVQLVPYKGKLFGMTQIGGANDGGVIFEWNPTNSQYTKRIEFGIPNGMAPSGLTFINSGGLFYGVVTTGTNNVETMFEWDEAKNLYREIREFTEANLQFIGGAGLNLVPSPAAIGQPGSCLTLPKVIIDGTNNNVWVPITDVNGDAVAEVNANGNNLGELSVSLFINTGQVREDSLKRLYLDRSLSIKPQKQPESPVDIRIYIRGAEFEALKNSKNSVGQSSGINSFSDLIIFKNSQECSSGIQSTAIPIQTTGVEWGAEDVVYTGSVSSFSTFYFSNKSFPLIGQEGLVFKVSQINNNGFLQWINPNNQLTNYFEIERSFDGSQFSVIGKVQASALIGAQNYSFTDNSINIGTSNKVFYRLRQVFLSGEMKFSVVVDVSISEDVMMNVYPNPFPSATEISLVANNDERVLLTIIDAKGSIALSRTWDVRSGTNKLPIDLRKLAKGVYFVKLKGSSINKQKTIVKQ